MRVFALVVVFCLANLGLAQEDYEAAVKKAEAENKPIIVVVGADWCQSCKVEKEFIEQMKKEGDFKEMILVYVDKDREPIAGQLMKGPILPQVIGFCKNGDGWKKYSLSGLSSKLKIKELLNKVRGK